MQLISDLVGRTLSGRYHLAARLAGGHLGEVYGGRDELLDRPVAVKVLKPSLALDEQAVEHFRREAQTAAGLSHPNAVAVYDWGADDGVFYMVMEHVPGIDLRDLLVSKGSLVAGHAVEIMAQTCDALGAAHARGLVHKDLKPENILVAQDGTVKVSDFGIGAVAGVESVSSSGMAAAVRYVAPEQALGFEPSATSDVWSAGAILAEILTGRLPLQGASGPDLLERRSHDQPVPPSTWDPSIPQDLDDIVMSACALDPAQRFHDGSDLANALRRAAVRSLPDAPPLTMLLDEQEQLRMPESEPTPFVKERARGRHGKPKLKLRIGRILLMILIVAGLVYGGYRGVAFVLAPGEVGVPNLIGLSRDEASDRATRRDLNLVVDATRNHKEIPEGGVVEQSPQDGVLEEGRSVSVILSSGPPTVKVPKLVDLPLGMLRTRLEGYGFETGRIVRRYSRARVGRVIKQIPGGGRLEWGSKIHFVVSRGPPPVDVPKIAGYAQTEAVRRLHKRGLKPQVFEAYSDAVPAGVVIYIEPEAGTTLRRGDRVKVVVSLGPEFEELTLPDVRGLRMSRAAAELQSLGLRTQVFKSCKNQNDIADTDPAPGTRVRENDLITLIVC
ncbi:MAG: PASTA domain-containing protein [Actinomycetota bacterium]|nr:PASTA domain-containing protein [Actinomycetota bacterium]